MPIPNTTSLLFVCMGNICRSPLAEGVFIHLARQRNILDRFRIDSCGTGNWHVGDRPDPRMIETADRHHIHLPSIARQLNPAADFPDLTNKGGFDYILAMDRDNRDAILASGAPPDRVHLFRAFDPALKGKPEDQLDVPDPYYGGRRGFETVYDMVHAAAAGLLDHLQSH